ncbi:MAG: type IV toxin-antitoxin system AbiEi family antitoxin domain-containing protein, partial [Chloroflexota bacterium]
ILSAKQSELLENLIVKYGQIVNTDQILTEAENNWDNKQAKNVITKLVKNGWLVRIKRGLYAISDFSSRGFLSLSPLVVANLLVPESYVSFEAALQHHNMFDQFTGSIVSVSIKINKPVKLSDIEYRFVSTMPRYFFGWQDVQVIGQKARIAAPEKALIDMVNFHKSQYSIDLVIEKLLEFKKDLNLPRLIGYLGKYPITTVKIFGLIFDLIGLDSENIYKLSKPAGTNWMLPGDKKFNAKWRLYYREYFDKYQTM